MSDLGEIFKFFGTIGLNTNEVEKDTKKATKTAEKESNKMSDHFKKAAKIIGGLFAGKKVFDFGRAAVEAAATREAIDAQFTQVFGDLEKDAEKAMNKLANEFGMIPSRLRQPLAIATSRFKGLGYSTEEAMKQAEKSVTAAADAAAFYDVSYESANESLASFIKGNYIGGEAIGIFANDTQMAQFAIQEGLVESTKDWRALDEATKQATRLDYSLNMQEMAGATGQAARESDEYENQMGNLKQAWEDFKVVIGGPLLQPIITGMMTLSDWLQTGADKLEQFFNWTKENETAVALIGVAIGTLTTLIIAYNIQQALATSGTTLWSAVTSIATGVGSAFGAVMTFLTSPIGLVILAIGGAIAIGVLLYKNWETVKQKASDLWSSILTIFTNIKDAIMKPINTATDAVGTAIDKIKGFFKFQWSFPKLKMPHFSVQGSANPLKWLSEGVPKLKVDWYAKGGIMTQPTIFGQGSDGTIRAGGERGAEGVIPLNRQVLGDIGRGIYESFDFSGLGGQSIDYDKLVNSIVEAFVKIVSNVGIYLSEREIAKLFIDLQKEFA